MPHNLVFLHSNFEAVCTARVDKFFEGYHTLQFMDEGAVELFYDQARWELHAHNETEGEPPNGAWFWPAFPGPHIRFHTARSVRSWRHRYAAFTGPRVESWKTAGLWPQIPQRAPRPNENRAQFDEVLTLIRAGDSWSLRRAAHGLEGLLLELAQARFALQSEPGWLQTVREFLAQTEDFAPDYNRIAREVGMGLSTLRRHFKAATGLSLHEALMQNRLDNARNLLGETDLPLKEIAARLGYGDVHFFSSQFKKLAGVSPATYRKSRQI